MFVSVLPALNPSEWHLSSGTTSIANEVDVTTCGIIDGAVVGIVGCHSHVKGGRRAQTYR